MAKVHILNVNVHNNPANFFTPFQFEIFFECLEDCQDDLEFKIIYVGSAETVDYDQILDQIVVDAVPKGQFKFMFQADPPNIKKIPSEDALGVTVILITASYRNQEFSRIGYYVNNEYEEVELKENPPSEPQFNKMVRTILSDQPRVTKFKINWVTTEEINNNVSQKASETPNLSSDNTYQKMEIDSTNSHLTHNETSPDNLFENKENPKNDIQNEYPTENSLHNLSKNAKETEETSIK